MAVPLIRYSGLFFLWTREGFKHIDKITIKLMTMDKALHPWDNIDILYESRKEGRRGLASIEDKVDESIQWHENYIETRNNTDNTRTNRTTITRKEKWEERQLCERFKRLTSDITHEKTWTWLMKGKLNRNWICSNSSTK